MKGMIPQCAILRNHLGILLAPFCASINIEDFESTFPVKAMDFHHPFVTYYMDVTHWRHRGKGERPNSGYKRNYYKSAFFSPLPVAAKFEERRRKEKEDTLRQAQGRLRKSKSELRHGSYKSDGFSPPVRHLLYGCDSLEARRKSEKTSGMGKQRLL